MGTRTVVDERPWIVDPQLEALGRDAASNAVDHDDGGTGIDGNPTAIRAAEVAATVEGGFDTSTAMAAQGQQDTNHTSINDTTMT